MRKLFDRLSVGDEISRPEVLAYEFDALQSG